MFYVRVESQDGVYGNLFASRSRVAPIKIQSIPRLELLGCLVLAMLVEHVRYAISTTIGITSEYYFSVSDTALCWVRDKNQKIKQFVEECPPCTDTKFWKHVKGIDNPADLVTRGMMPSELKACKFWRAGPDWLRLPPEQWPLSMNEPKQTEESVNEMKVVDRKSMKTEQTLLVAVQPNFFEFE